MNKKILPYLLFGLLFSFLAFLKHNSGESAPNVYPEFQEYADYADLKIYRVWGYQEFKEILLEEPLKKELFKLLNKTLVLGTAKGDPRFNTTSSFRVEIAMHDERTFSFYIMIEGDERLEVLFEKRSFVSDELLAWMWENEILRRYPR